MKIKKRLKTTLAILMAIALLAVGSPIITVAAEGTVCKIGETPYTSIADAVDAATDGAVIDVIADTTISPTITISKKITLTSSNESEITCTGGVKCIDVNGDGADLTISGNLKITYAASEPIYLSKGRLEIKDNVVLTATFHTICMPTNTTPTSNITELVVSGGTIIANGTQTQTKSAIFNGTRYAKITINGGTIKSTMVGAILNRANNLTLDINGGEVIADKVAVFYERDAGGTINVTGGTIKTVAQNTNGNQCFYLNNGVNKTTLNISDGTIDCKGTNALYFYGASGGVELNVSGGYISSTQGTITFDCSNLSANITGGEIVATTENGIKFTGALQSTVVNISGDAKVTAPKNALLVNNVGSTFNVSGGTFTATDKDVVKLQLGTLNVTGGTFILNSTNSNANIISSTYDSDMEMSATANIKGGLFINENTANTALFNVAENAEPINYEAGKLMYTNNITHIVAGSLAAPKTVEAVYDWNGNNTADVGETYYIYNRFAGADEANAGVMVEGATVRLVENSNGLRFTTDFSKAVVDALAAKGTVTYGTIIVPTEYLTSLDSFTVAALTAKYGANGYLNIVCEDGKGLIKNEDGSVAIQAAIVNIKTENYDTQFSAVAYACVGGEYYYTAFDQSANSATIKDIATAALADTEAAYTDAQKAILNGYVA